VRRSPTNDCFLATPHRAVNRAGGECYALAFFCDAQIDWPIAGRFFSSGWLCQVKLDRLKKA
jgi:isopenicillin N synthase-like dioxygenase